MPFNVAVANMLILTIRRMHVRQYAPVEEPWSRVVSGEADSRKVSSNTYGYDIAADWVNEVI